MKQGLYEIILFLFWDEPYAATGLFLLRLGLKLCQSKTDGIKLSTSIFVDVAICDIEWLSF